jgi:hypothetical protein
LIVASTAKRFSCKKARTASLSVIRESSAHI